MAMEKSCVQEFVQKTGSNVMSRNTNGRTGCSRSRGQFAARRVGILLGMVLVTAFGAPSLAVAAEKTAAPEIVVRKSPYCGCCSGWVAIMRKKGFKVTVENVENLELHKKLAGVPEKLQACHTAVVSGYVVEGHVPAASIRKLLAAKPKARGIAVPGMPMGSPGMGEGGEGFNVVIFDRNGNTKVFDKY